MALLYLKEHRPGLPVPTFPRSQGPLYSEVGRGCHCWYSSTLLYDLPVISLHPCKKAQPLVLTMIPAPTQTPLLTSLACLLDAGADTSSEYDTSVQDSPTFPFQPSSLAVYPCSDTLGTNSTSLSRGMRGVLLPFRSPTTWGFLDSLGPHWFYRVPSHARAQWQEQPSVPREAPSLRRCQRSSGRL